jgi:serine/threonine-protein kinase
VIVASEFFASAARPRSFLEFVIGQTLAGKQAFIKESVLGSEVFGREPNYDPRADAIVRVEATKLRARLADFYAGPGKSDAVLIEIPKGSYIPRFTLREPAGNPRGARFHPRILTAAAVAALVIASGVWVVFRKAPRDSDQRQETPAIAVLPFLNLSSDPENEYFSDGLTEQLTDVLAQVDGLRVASRTSAFSFKGKPAEAGEIGAKLHVGAILEGSVRKSGDQLRITAQLIRTSDGYHLWSKTFDRTPKEIFELQDELSGEIARTLKVTLAQDAKRRMFRRYTTNIEAFDRYLRGRFILNSFRPDAPARAVPLFEQAIDLDPRFAMAYVGIAIAGSQEVFTELRSPAAIVEQMKTAAEKALQIDSSLAEAHAILADVRGRFEWNWPAAERGFQKAIELNPRSPEAHFHYALNVLLPLRRFDRALAECRKTVELDSVTTQWALCTPWVWLFQDPEMAIAEYKRLIASDPDNYAYWSALAIACAYSGRERESIEILERMNTQSNPGGDAVGDALLGYAYGRVGRTADALRIERKVKARSPGYVSPGTLAMIYLGMGRLPEARQAVREQIRERSGNAYYLAFSPEFESLRRDPEFIPLLKTIGLPF